MNTSAIAAGFTEVRRRIRDACARSGRDAKEVALVAVSKGRGVEAIEAALALGQRDLGENRVQELATQSRALAGRGVLWHFIGSLQTNKVRDLLRCEGLTLLHSLDRVALADEIEKVCSSLGRGLDCLLQVHTADDPRKHGVSIEEAEDLVRHVDERCPQIRILGLMTMGPLDDDDSLTGARSAFASAHALAQRLRGGSPRSTFDILSMGMSADLELAVDEGSTLVRAGTAVFGTVSGSGGSRSRGRRPNP